MGRDIRNRPALERGIDRGAGMLLNSVVSEWRN